MTNQRIRVAVNEYGVLGKRVADVVGLEDDMSLAGVSDVVADYRARLARERDFPLRREPLR